MCGGFNKGINIEIEKINNIIKKEGLNLPPLFIHYDEKWNKINDSNPKLEKKYDEVIERAYEVIGKLKSLILTAAHRVDQKKEVYKKTIRELEEIIVELKQNRKY